MTTTERDETYGVTYEQVWQAWHDTSEPWGGCADREAVERVMALLLPAKCDMKHTPPMDFAHCETHDTTFPLGSTCKFDGREPWQVYADEADEQRRRAVMAEHRVDVALADVSAAFGHPVTGDDLRSLGAVAAAHDHKLSAAALNALGYLADRPKA